MMGRIFSIANITTNTIANSANKLADNSLARCACWLARCICWLLLAMHSQQKICKSQLKSE
jgi:hypothetical protein